MAGGGTPTAPHLALAGQKILRIAGSTALAPLFQEAQHAFDPSNGAVTHVLPTGSTDGLQQVAAGTADIGMSDIFASEKGIVGLSDDQVAAAVFTLVVSPDLGSTITNLTMHQIAAIYTGTITNWSQIAGGPNEPITVIGRSPGSGTRATFVRYVLQPGGAQDAATKTTQVAASTQDLVNAVAAHPGAIGYIATNFVLNEPQATRVTPICIDGFGATAANVEAGSYQFWTFEHAYTRTGTLRDGQHGILQAFLAFLNSSSFQTLALPRYGFLQVGQIPASVAATHQIVP